MNYPDSVEFLYSLGNEVKTFKLGLERIIRVLEELGNPQKAFRTVHVAGTNGKGSTCAMIESVLRVAGARTGLYTSPHLIEPTERIRINGDPVSREDFAAAFDRVHALSERLLDAGELDFHPSYFETVTAMAFLLFREKGVQVAVVEVGLGGRLDATNVLTPEICVIAPVDFDHEVYLGNSLEAIASEKAGILKPGVPAVFAVQRPEAERVLSARAEEVGAPVTRTNEYEVRAAAIHARGSCFTASRTRPIQIDCPLAGVHQVDNALTAAATMDVLGLPVEAIEEGIRTAKWPGRMELIRENPDVLLDGAHNPAGARALAAYLAATYKGDREIWMVYGTMRDKSVNEIAEVLFPLAKRVIVTAPQFPRAIRPEALLEATEHPNMTAAPDVRTALQVIDEAPRNAVVVITGSLYLVGEARGLLVQ
jgi:dihydrofolate synthase/folylpolyglutamate synthase